MLRDGKGGKNLQLGAKRWEGRGSLQKEARKEKSIRKEGDGGSCRGIIGSKIIFLSGL